MRKTETALISGASGFLGQHITNALKEREITPIAIPRSMLYQPYTDLMSFVQKHNPTIIIHAAGYGNHGHQQEEDKIIMANYFATWNLLQASKYVEYRAFINVATSSMYGKQNEPMFEEMCLKPDTFYAASKAASVHLVRVYARQYNKPTASVVPFSVYGPGEADFRFIPTVCKHLITGEKMPFVSWPRHDWIMVTDFVDGLLTVIDNIEQLKGEMVNIGTGVEVENLAVARKLSIIANKTLETEATYREQPHHSGHWQAVNLKLTGLGWEPKFDLDAGLRATWEYYAEKYRPQKKNC